MNYSIVFCLLLSLTTCGLQAVYSSTDNEFGETLKEFCIPLQFTRTGIRSFFKEHFNHRAYAQNFLPHNCNDLVQFLNYGIDTQQGPNYFKSSICLFTNKYKASCYMAERTVNELLDVLGTTLEQVLAQGSQTEQLATRRRQQVKSVLFSSLRDKFTLLKQDPEQFFETVADDMLRVTNSEKEVQEKLEMAQLIHQTLRFLELLLQKVIWNPFDQELVWESIKLTADKLATLVDKNIINYDDLDDLYKSLLERLCYFLDVSGSDLSLETIKAIRADVESGQLLLVELEEQEEFIESKKERLLDVLLQTEARVHARARGILSEVIAY